MKRPAAATAKTATLRVRAESALAAGLGAGAAAPPDSVAHELRVYQIELEMQNAELEQLRAAAEAARDRFIDLYDLAPVGYFTLDLDGTVVEANLTGAALLGVERKRLLQRKLARFVMPHDAGRWHLHLRQVARHGPAQRVEVGLRTGHGTAVNVQIDTRLVETTGKRLQVRATLTDITEYKRAEADLRIGAIAFEAQQAMFVCDAQMRVQRVNSAYTGTTGFTAQETLGHPPSLFSVGQHDEAFHQAMWQTVREHGAWHGEMWDRRKSGEAYPIWLSVTAVTGAEGATANYVVTFADISQRRIAEDEIRQLAFYDPLTQLPNRRLLLDRLARTLATNALTREQGALMFIDLDNFKVLNDTLGHDKGDDLLEQVAARLTDCVRAAETVARLGGDEFVVLLNHLPANARAAVAQVDRVGQRIQSAMAEPFLVDGREHLCGASIGVTVFCDAASHVGDLMRQADLAMYSAKAQGRSRICHFHPDMVTAANARAAFEADLRRALRDGEFRLHYQPQIDAALRLTGFEALVRWQHPKRGLVPPAEFIAVAEDCGLIVPLGGWVLNAACAQLAAWAGAADTAALTMAVNVSARQLRDAAFVRQVSAALAHTGAPAARLKLELTETVMLDDVADTATKMAALQALGIGFSLDDFGTGYSSLSYLKRLPFQQIKIDRSFVQDMLADANDAAIVRSILTLARSLGLQVIAEGVETVEQRDFLASHGCDGYQGYLFGRPQAVDAIDWAALFSA